MKKITFLILSFLFTNLIFAQGTETFDNLTLTGSSYSDGNFQGQDGSTWNYLQSRGDFQISGQALMLGRNRTPDAEVESGSIANGIGTLSFDYMQAFSTDVNLEVYVNSILVGTVTSSNQQDVILNSNTITVNQPGNFTIRFFNPTGGQVAIDNVTWTSYNGTATPVLAITSPNDGTVFTPNTTNVDVSFTLNNFTISSNASANDGDGYIQYSLDGGTTYTDKFDDTDISLTNLTQGSYTVLVQLVDNSGNTLNPNVEEQISFSIPTINQASDIAALRAGSIDDYYNLTGEAVLTYQRANRNQKYIEDNSGAILIDDPDENITTTYNIWDGITGITGQLANYNGVLQFVPLEDPGVATSTGNSITPQIISISEFNNDPDSYESELIAFQNITVSDIIDGDGTFQGGESYEISNGSETSVLRTNFYDADYIGSVLPSNTINLVGLGAEFNGNAQIYPRNSNDIDATLATKSNTQINFSLYPNPAKGQVTIQTETTNAVQVEVFDILGKKVIAKKVSNGNLNISSLNAGLYLVKVTQNGVTSTKKLIVK